MEASEELLQGLWNLRGVQFGSWPTPRSLRNAATEPTAVPGRRGRRDLGYLRLCVRVVPETSAPCLLSLPPLDGPMGVLIKKEKEVEEKLYPPRIHPLPTASTASARSSLHHCSPGPGQSPPPRSLGSSLDLIVWFPHNSPRAPVNTRVRSCPSSAYIPLWLPPSSD